MPRHVTSDLGISVKATNPFSPRRERSSSQETLKQGVTGDERSTQADTKSFDRPKIKFPVLTQSRRVNDEGNSNLQVLLRGVQCFDFSLEGSEFNTPRKKSSPSSVSQDLELDSVASQAIKREKDSIVYVQNHGEIVEGDKDKTKDFGNVLPLSSSILEGQRLNIREKERLNTKRASKQFRYEQTEQGNKLPYQTDSTYKYPEIENNSSKLSETQRTVCNVVPLRPYKQVERPVFQLPKADNYDITPRNIINSKACSVLKMSHRSSLFDSDYKSSQWIPRRDSYVIKSSVFKTILQQPAVFLRQPSPVAGVKMTLKEQEDSLAEAIPAVEETNIQPPSVDVEATRQIKKFVIRLPPIC